MTRSALENAASMLTTESLVTGITEPPAPMAAPPPEYEATDRFRNSSECAGHFDRRIAGCGMSANNRERMYIPAATVHSKG